MEQCQTTDLSDCSYDFRARSIETCSLSLWKTPRPFCLIRRLLDRLLAESEASLNRNNDVPRERCTRLTSFERYAHTARSRMNEPENERERETGRNPFFEGSEACLHCDAKERDHVFRWELPALEIARLPLKLARRRTIGLITGHLSADLALPFLLLFFPTRGSLCDSCSRGCFSI